MVVIGVLVVIGALVVGVVVVEMAYLLTSIYGFEKARVSTMWHSKMQPWLYKIIAKTVSD